MATKKKGLKNFGGKKASPFRSGKTKSKRSRGR